MFLYIHKTGPLYLCWMAPIHYRKPKETSVWRNNLVEKVQKNSTQIFLPLFVVQLSPKPDINKLANERIDEYNEYSHSVSVKLNSDDVNVLNLHKSLSVLPKNSMLLFNEKHLNY